MVVFGTVRPTARLTHVQFADTVGVNEETFVRILLPVAAVVVS